MTKNPVINALSALAYISMVASVMNFVTKMGQQPNKTILGPIAFLSLISLSAAMMGFIFLYQPVLMLTEGKKKQAVNLFLQTVCTFAVITAVLFFLVFSGILKNFIPVNF